MSKLKSRKISNTARLSNGRICDALNIDKSRVESLLYESNRTPTEGEYIFLENCERRLNLGRELAEDQREKLSEVENQG